jgi:DNA-binding transcriptional regulator YhcF (GntR family)
MKAKDAPRYQQIARQLKAAIEQGELTSGRRLPSSRVYAAGTGRFPSDGGERLWRAGGSGLA